AADEGRVAVALGDEVVVALRPSRLEGTFVAHDAKALRVEAADDTMILAYLIEPARSEYLLDDLEAEDAGEAKPEPAAEEGAAGAAAPPRARAPAPACAAARAGRRAGSRAALPRRRDAARPCSLPDGDRRSPHRHVPDGGDHRPSRRPRRGARVPRLRARG